MTIGIYRLVFPNTDKCYIGQSVNIETRYRTHLQHMLNGRSSKKLYSAYLTYGEPSLDIICECDTSELNVCENEAIQIFNCVEDGFNTLDSAESTPNISGFNSGNAKYTKEDILQVAVLLQDPLNKVEYIEELTGVKSRTVTEVSNLSQHSDWLLKEYPELYNAILNLKGKRVAVHNKNSAQIRSTKMSAAARGITYPLIVNPDGVTFNVTNTSAFAKEHNLHNGHLVALLNKKAKSHKGWKLCQNEQV